MNTLWLVLTIVAVVTLFIYRGGKNAVWGGLTLGIVIGLIIAIVAAIGDGTFNAYTILKSAVIAIFLGVAAELLGKVSNSRTKK